MLTARTFKDGAAENSALPPHSAQANDAKGLLCAVAIELQTMILYKPDAAADRSAIRYPQRQREIVHRMEDGLRRTIPRKPLKKFKGKSATGRKDKTQS